MSETNRFGIFIDPEVITIAAPIDIEIRLAQCDRTERWACGLSVCCRSSSAGFGWGMAPSRSRAIHPNRDAAIDHAVEQITDRLRRHLEAGHYSAGPNQEKIERTIEEVKKWHFMRGQIPLFDDSAQERHSPSTRA